MIVGIAAGIAALICVVAHFGYVVFPLHQAGRAMQRLDDSANEGMIPVAGVQEIQTGLNGFNDVLSSLRLAEAQAVALAEERFDDPILATVAPGNLGQSLQVAVQKLTTSLAERDEFEERLTHEASYDGLTQIPNRTATLRHLEAAMARSRRNTTTLSLIHI